MSTGTMHEPRQQRSHPILRITAWLFGIGASALTGLLIWIAVALVREWSGYVGGESTTALLILGFVGLVTLSAWLVTWVLVRMLRN